MSKKSKKTAVVQEWTQEPSEKAWAPAAHVPDLQEVLVVSLHGQYESDYYPASNHTWSISTDKDLSIISDTVRVGYYSNSNFVSIKGMTIDVAYGYVLSGRAVVKPEVVEPEVAEEVREYDEEVVEEAELPE